MFEDVHPFVSAFHRIQLASEAWQVSGSRTLRRSVFCVEQGLFESHDEDDVDSTALTLVALAATCGYPDEVVATVRIHRGEAPGDWWGSRLAVERAYRSNARLGTALIRCAVGTALTMGCERFFAHVQVANGRLFERLAWRRLAPVILHGRPHLLMQADLDAYEAVDLIAHPLTTAHSPLRRVA